MKKISMVATYGFMTISALSLLSVSVMAFINPQSVMDLVDVQLSNNDAFSSIRGVYGGAGLTISLTIVYFMFRDQYKGLVFLAFFWGSYALSRIITAGLDGPLGDFGRQWLMIESSLFILALLLIQSRRIISLRLKNREVVN